MNSIKTLVLRVAQLSGWRRLGLVFFLGGVDGLAFPPFGFVPILWFSFPLLIVILRHTVRLPEAFVVGWFFAFGYFMFNLYWIAASMFVDIAQFWWAVPLAVAGLPAFLSIYYGIAAAIAHRVGLQGASGCILFSVFWLIADYARGHLFTGFPWSLEAYVWDRVLPMLQITSVVGAYGLSLITLVWASAPAAWSSGKTSGRAFILVCLASMFALFVWGEMRLRQDVGLTVPGVRVRLVQPNVDQAVKWKDARVEEGFRQLLNLSSAPPHSPSDKIPTEIIWPETASTFYLANDTAHRRLLASTMSSDSIVMTGVIRGDRDTSGIFRFYNSLIAIDDSGQVVAHYDKAHLVPYGEYMPLRTLLPWHALVPLQVDFSSGDGPHTQRVKGFPSFSAFICYEAIFPGQLTDPLDRPDVLINITNDGWYGNTTGPYQHFAIARVRAIEEGLPLLRAANTGVSGAVDAYGRITARLGLARSGFLDTDLGTALPPTFFVRTRDYLLWAMAVLLGFGALAARRCTKIS